MYLEESSVMVSALTTSEELVEAELPLTPIQQELIFHISKSTEPETIFFELHLPKHALTSFDLIQHTWQAVASHNPVLRTQLEIPSTHTLPIRGKQRILKRVALLQFGQLLVSRNSRYHEAAQLVISMRDHRLSVSTHIHRALVDDLSIGLIRKDFELFHMGLAFDRHPRLDKFVRHTCSKDHHAAKLFWNANLDGIVSAPIHCFPSEVSALKAWVTAALSGKSSSRMRAFAAGVKVPVQTVFYAAWASTLAWHTEAGYDKVAFTVTGRDLSLSKSHYVVGPADQMYPLKVALPQKTLIEEWLGAINRANEEASSHAFIGYREILAQTLEPFGQTLVTIRSTEENPTTTVHLHKFAIIIEVVLADQITVTLHYSQEALEDQARLLLNHYISALSSISDGYTRTVGGVDLISPSERKHLLELAQPVTKPTEGLVHHLFEAQVQKTPNAPAVQFETNTSLSYLQLNKLANAVARQLRCDRGSYVPVCMRRSVNLIVTLLAILKTGAAYVTLDPDVPSKRNNFIFQDVGASFAVIDRESVGMLPVEVVIEDLIEGAERQNDTDLAIVQSYDDIVYIIYTSGSTGHPKGVLLEHRAAYSGLAAFPLIKDLRQLLFHNPVFSAAQRSIWSTLKQGGCLCLASKENLTMFIGNTINVMDINTIDVTPSTATLITPGSVPNLKRMTVAGELINPALVPMWIDRLELMNAYGLSENTQFNWRHVIDKGQNPQIIGRPSDTTTVYVLRPGTVELAPLLIPGELCLGGFQLARGYLNRPEKTSEAFINNPFGPGRLYRTGDLVVTHVDGSIEMIGRIDFSIKINDQRIEPGESNSILQLHPQVQDSAVVAASISGRRLLVAVAVPRAHTHQTSLLKELREQLEKQLPLYMVPSYWLARKELPLNVNGKVDVPALRKICEALGRSGLLQRSHQMHDQEPHVLSAEEEIIRDLWAESLSMPASEILKTDSFLSIGGTSLDAIVVSSRALQSGLRITLSHLLQGYSISRLAREMTLRETVKTSGIPKPFALAPSDASINFSEVEDVFPATPLQEGLIADSILGKTDYMFRKAFSFTGISLSHLQKAFETVVRETQLPRTVFVAHGISFLQVIQKQIEIPWENLDIDLDTYLKQKRDGDEFVALDKPLLRITTLKSNVIVVETHHALFDFWSNSFLYQDVRAVIKGEARPIRLPFSVFVQHLKSRDEELSRQFWKSYLKDARPTSLEATPDSAFCLEADLNFDLKSALSTNQLTAGVLLYAAWAITLSAWTSSNDVTFMVNISGREVPIKDILTMNGPTLTTVPMRVNIGSHASVPELARALIPEFWRLAEHAHLGLRNVLRASGLRPSLTNTAVNFLIRIEPETCDVLQPLDIAYQNATDFLNIEMEERSLYRLKMFSNRGFVNADLILEDVMEVLRVAVENPHTEIAEVLLRIGPHRQYSQTPASASTIDRHNDSSEQLFDGWKSYITGSEPSILNHRPTERKSSIKQFPSVALGAAAVNRGVSQEALWYASWGAVLALHTNTTNPLFGVICSGGKDRVEPNGSSLHFTPQRVNTGTDLSLRQVATSVDEDLHNKADSCKLRLDQASDFASQHSTVFDTFVMLRIADHNSKGLRQGLGYDDETSNYPYTILDIDSQPGKTILSLSSRMEHSRAEFILNQLFTMIQAMVTDPSLTASSIELISKEEKSMLYELAEFTTPVAELVHKRFERFACETPDKLALQWELSEWLTYKALNERANRLARYLIQAGVTTGQMIPLLLDKSVETVVSILAVLKTGASYVPMSPDNPPDRNLFILDQVAATVVITHSLYKDFAALHCATSVFVDRLPSMDNFSSLDTGIGDIDSLAYCIYTSGSTGSPKGVNVSHRSISIAVEGMIKGEGITSDWRLLTFANYVFDVSVHDIFTILGSGGTLCMASSERSLSDLAGVINEMGVAQTFLTPTVARLISPDDVPGLETLMCSGEPITADIIRAWAPHRSLINLYGPTECSVNVTVGFVRPETSPTALGKPYSTVSAMIIEINGTNLAPYGAIGEICIGGGHVGEGYMNRDDLTAKVFTPSPIVEVGRMYRTGDLGRWLPGGILEYLGRMDHQIKLNGHRIELGEIEQVILRSGLVHDCAAILLENFSRPQLAVFCIFEVSTDANIQAPQGYTSKLHQLKESLGSLAYYMAPKTVFPMGRFPRSSANKTDRKQLKQMAEGLDAASLSQYSLDAPGSQDTAKHLTSEEEIFLQRTWSNLFQIDRSSIGATTNFFAIGGDSIAAINLVSACRKADYTLSVSDVLKLATLDRIATRLKKISSGRQPRTLQEYKPPNSLNELLGKTAIKNEDIDYIYPCPPGQAEFLSQGNKDTQNWVVTAARPFAAHHSVERYMDLIQELTRVNDILRTTFTNLPGHGWVGVVLKKPVLDFVVRECELAERNKVLDEVNKRRFVFGDCLVSYVLLKYPDGSRDIVIKMDHGLWDGTSLRIFDDTILALQKDGSNPKNTEFKDFAFDQWRSDKSRALEFWKKLLTGKKEAYPRATNPMTTRIFRQDIDTKVNIDGLASSCGVTPAIAFQGAFQVWLAEKSGLEEASYDYLLTGRNVDLPNPQTINGPCANFLPFRIPVDRTKTLRSFLADTQDFFWQAAEYGNVALNDIFAAANLDRNDTGNTCLFLFQPFEPDTGPAKPEMRWVVLAQSQARMPQSYALVEEIHKLPDGYKIVIKYDGGVYTLGEVEEIAQRQIELIKRFLEVPVETTRLQELFL